MSTSPYRRHQNDVEAGRYNGDDGDETEDEGPFSIYRTKSASLRRLKSWRQRALVLNASRRFRYTLDLKKDEEKKQMLAKIRTHAENVRAALLFQNAGSQLPAPGAGPQLPAPAPIPEDGYGIGPKQLASLMRGHDFPALQRYGGVKGLAVMLKTNEEKGIEEEEASHRRNVFGSNMHPRKKGRGFGRFLLDAFRDYTLIILMVAAAASFALGMKAKSIKEGWYDGGSIALAVIISSVITAISDYRQSLQFQSLNKVKQDIQVEVIRGGRRVMVSIFDIVVGDVVPLRIGDLVPADGILIFGHCLSIDESRITGENKLVHKNSEKPFLMDGCIVADGYGSMLVTSVGLNTEWGMLLANTLDDNGEETALQVHLNGVATYVGTIGIGLAFVVLLVLMFRYFTGHTNNPNGSVQFRGGKTKIAESMDGAVKILTVAVTIVIVAIPEGLPLAIIVTLAYSTRKMMAEKALVLRLSACEIMGSATTICTHKTGTLTSNLMTVVEVFICGEKILSPNNRSSIPPAVTSLLIEGIAQNTTGSVFMPEHGEDTLVFGSPTEKAILHWGLDLGMNFDAVRSDSSVIHTYPFNSVKKRGGVLLNLPNSEAHIHWKGAAEIVLAKCTRYVDSNGYWVAINEDKVTLFKKAIQDMTCAGLCCIAIAFRSYQMENIPTDKEELANWCLPEDDLVLLAIIGIKNPLRPGVEDAVQQCINASVKVCMVTGDNLQTARAIALECGILRRDADATEPNIIEGRTFRALCEAQRENIAEKISVMGRSSPHDKLLLVQALRKRGQIVAVTGAGATDAPALDEADVGLAMGVQGTQVAKDHSDIIILDDNFVSIVKVVRWGRSIYANIQKFVQFQLTLNVAAVMITVLDAISGEVPYNAVQLLWVNMVMDTLGVLAMATERPQDNLMRRAPIRRREPLITNIIWRNFLIQALYQVTVVLVLNSQFKSMLNLEHDESVHAAKVKNTLIFNGFIFCQIFNEFNARKPEGINVFKGVTKNYFFIGIVCLTILLQVIIITFLGKFTSSVRLNWKLWLLSILIGFISWPLVTIAKLIPVPKAPFSKFLKRNFFKLKKLTGIGKMG